MTAIVYILQPKPPEQFPELSHNSQAQTHASPMKVQTWQWLIETKLAELIGTCYKWMRLQQHDESDTPCH